MPALYPSSTLLPRLLPLAGLALSLVAGWAGAESGSAAKIAGPLRAKPATSGASALRAPGAVGARVEVRLSELTPATLDRLRSIGLEVSHSSYRHARVYGTIDPDRLGEIAAIAEVATIHPDYPVIAVAPVPGETALELLAAFGGSLPPGTELALLSDGFAAEGGTVTGSECARTVTGLPLQMAGALPPAMTLLQGTASATGAGAALATVLSSVHPASPLLFHSAAEGLADYAEGVGELVQCGAEALVSNVVHPAEPMFQEGIVAAAMREATEAGTQVVNLARERPVWGLDAVAGSLPGLHDFGGGELWPRLVVPPSCSVTFVLQWDEPFSGALGPGARSDLDLLLCDAADPGACERASRGRQGCGVSPDLSFGDPLEVVRVDNPGTTPVPLHLAVDRVCGGERPRFRVAAFGDGCDPEPQSAVFRSIRPYESSPGSFATIAVLEPDGVSDVVAEGRDYAKWELANAWDMSGGGCPDTIWDEQFTCDVALTETTGVSGEAFTVDAGATIYEGTAATGDPVFWTVFPGPLSANNLTKGALAPISSSQYRHFSTKVRYPSGPQSAALLAVQWFLTQGLEPFGLAQEVVTADNSWQIVDLDLTTESEPAPRAAWTSEPQWHGLRLDPATVAGFEFDFDWIRLTAPGGPENMKTIEWSASGTGGASFAIDAIDAAGDALTLASGLPAGTTQHTVDFSKLPPGNYTIRVRTASTAGLSCGGCLTINDAPVMTLTQPDKAGDESNDYPVSMIGNPWGPFEPAELETFNTSGDSTTGGVFQACNTNDDPYLFPPVPTPVPSSRYRMASLTFQMDGPRDIAVGSVFRLLWGNDRTALSTSDDFIVQEGVNTYRVGDLADVNLEFDLPSDWLSGPHLNFRFDPHEFPSTRCFDIYEIRLAPYDTASSPFQFEWQDADDDDDASIEIYYDLDQLAGSGNETLANPTTAIHEDALGSGGQVTLNPADVGLRPGRVYEVYGRISDGVNSLERYASGPLQFDCNGADFPDLGLSDPNVTGQVIEIACLHITAGSYVVRSDAAVEFLAGATITLEEGFSVESDATFTAEIDPALLP